MRKPFGHMPNPDGWITREPDDRDDGDRCHHGVPYEEECQACYLEDDPDPDDEDPF
jgi:hypothetical protein